MFVGVLGYLFFFHCKLEHIAFAGIHACSQAHPVSFEMPKNTLYSHSTAAELVVRQPTCIKYTGMGNLSSHSLVED